MQRFQTKFRWNVCILIYFLFFYIMDIPFYFKAFVHVVKSNVSLYAWPHVMCFFHFLLIHYAIKKSKLVLEKCKTIQKSKIHMKTHAGGSQTNSPEVFFIHNSSTLILWVGRGIRPKKQFFKQNVPLLLKRHYVFHLCVDEIVYPFTLFLGFFIPLGPDPPITLGLVFEKGFKKRKMDFVKNHAIHWIIEYFCYSQNCRIRHYTRRKYSMSWKDVNSWFWQEIRIYLLARLKGTFRCRIAPYEK